MKTTKASRKLAKAIARNLHRKKPKTLVVRRKGYDMVIPPSVQHIMRHAAPERFP